MWITLHCKVLLLLSCFWALKPNPLFQPPRDACSQITMLMKGRVLYFLATQAESGTWAVLKWSWILKRNLCERIGMSAVDPFARAELLFVDWKSWWASRAAAVLDPLLCLPGSAGLFPRLLGNSHPPCFATSSSQACCKQSSSYCSLYHLGKTWFTLVHLWWYVVVARHNGHCTAVDLSKDVSVWAKAMCRIWGEKCGGLLPLAFATGMKWKHLWWSLTQIVVSSGEIAWN